MKLSARNQLKGVVEKVENGVTTSLVKVKVQGPFVLSALITKEASDDLKLKSGDQVHAVIKATEIIIGKD